MIRPAVRDDAERIAAIYNHHVENTVITFEVDPVSPGEMASRISRETHPWLVADEEGSVQGYAYATRWKLRAAYVNTVETAIYVAPDQCGKGLGTYLYAALLDQLRSNGIHSALGGIALPNPASIALHEKLGFKKVGELKEVGWKLGRWIDVGYWQLIL